VFSKLYLSLRKNGLFLNLYLLIVFILVADMERNKKYITYEPTGISHKNKLDIERRDFITEDNNNGN